MSSGSSCLELNSRVLSLPAEDRDLDHGAVHPDNLARVGDELVERGQLCRWLWPALCPPCFERVSHYIRERFPLIHTYIPFHPSLWMRTNRRTSVLYGPDGTNSHSHLLVPWRKLLFLRTGRPWWTNSDAPTTGTWTPTRSRGRVRSRSRPYLTSPQVPLICPPHTYRPVVFELPEAPRSLPFFRRVRIQREISGQTSSIRRKRLQL